MTSLLLHTLAAGSPGLLRGTTGSAGLDLRANSEEIIYPGEVAMINTGICIELPHSTAGFIFSRSGLGCGKDGRRLVVSQGVGVIDEDYRGELIVPLANDGMTEEFVSLGDRIAQLVVIPIIYLIPKVTTVLNGTERGEGGFGSTGIA